MWNEPLDENTATKSLERIQAGKTPVCMRLCNANVTIEPLEHNAFRILIDMSVTGAMKAAIRLNDIGADIQPWKPKITDTAIATVTWDSMLHYLIMTGDLK